ncbi:MAG: TetR/AcrR family transcriptional regulator [Deferrisomatales bacterium]|nr:TetR/AcrR family transcriptional regulator [Deferrisomatales bacterium]
MPHPDDRRAQIFTAGARLFAEKGYGRTSLQEVADALGVTRPALYYYYRSKEELLFEITSFVMDRVAADLQEVAAGSGSPLEKLRDLIGRYVRFFASHPHELTIMSTEVDSLGPERREVILERQRGYLRTVRSIVRELLGDHPGTPLDETSVAFALLGGMSWIFKWYDPAGRVSPEKLAADFTRLFTYGLQGPPRGEE